MNPKNVINIKGYVVGNGITDFNYDGYTRQEDELKNAFNVIPLSLYKEIQ